MSKFRLGITSWLAVVLLGFVAGCGEEAVTVPLVVSTIPANGATAVAVNTPISATFSMAMNPASISATSFTLAGPGGAVAGAVAFSGLTATFTPAAALAYGATYTGTITTGATDLGGTPLQANYVWTFTTVAPPLVVVSTVPVNTATGVPLTQVVSATFNQALSCATLESPASTFVLTGPGTTSVAGAVSCAGTVATFTPAVDLVVNTVYTATITTGAQDLAGTALGANYVWTFRTLPAPTPPTVISTVPVNLATGVPINQALSATFSVAMNAATIDATTFTLAGPGGAVTGVVTYVAAGSVATFTPGANLAPSTVYTATITTGAEDLAGVGLAAKYVWTFTTAAAVVLTPPTVTSTIPVNAATGVPLNQIVSATFSVPMNASTINSGTFTLTGPGATNVNGLVAYAVVGNTLTFTPTLPLTASTLYTATITTGAQDLAGAGLAANYVWTFTTGTSVVAVPPEIVSTDPASGATGVPLNQAISATFSEAMNPLTLTTGTFLLYQGTSASGTPIPGTVSSDTTNTIWTFTPSALLTASTSYTATVTNGATNTSGTPLGTTGAPNPWTFTTGTPVLGPTISLFGAFGGNSGITNEGLFTVVNADIGTTAASTLITGFHDDSVISSTGVAECTYTESTAPPATGLVGAASATSPGTGVTAIFTAPGTSQPVGGCHEASGPATLAGTTAYVASQAAAEALAAYNKLQCSCNPAAGTTPTGVIGASLPSELGGLTLAPGTWTNASTVGITSGNLTLDGQNDPNATWIFQIGTTLTVGEAIAPRSVTLINGANAANVYWLVGSAATINYGGGGTMVGTIISDAATTLSSPAESTTTSATTFLTGRAIALFASTTMVNTIINLP
jgi:hypothetical protein